MTIRQHQDEIIREFSLLEGDQEMTLFYIMELGQKLPVMSETDKTEENTVKGCQSKVWMITKIEDERVFFTVDSNTAITKGLVSLLVRVFSGQTPEDILSSELFFMGKIGMERFIGTQRSNGFAAMTKQMKLYALAYKTKLELKHG